MRSRLCADTHAAWPKNKKVHSGVSEVITALRSTNAIERATTGCWLVQHHSWSSSEAEVVAQELSEMIRTYTDISLVVQAAEALTTSHPATCILLEAMAISISRERLNAGDWHRRRDACDIVRALGHFDSQAAFAENH